MSLAGSLHLLILLLEEKGISFVFLLLLGGRAGVMLSVLNHILAASQQLKDMHFVSIPL